METLTKGANITITVPEVTVELSWAASRNVPDVDVSALLCGSSGQVSGDHDFVFYNQPQHPSEPVRHLGRDGSTDRIRVNLSATTPAVEKVVVAASADGRFAHVAELGVTVSDATTGTPLLRFPIDGDTETAMIAGELYRRAGAWKFRAIGQGYSDGLAGLARDYGITVNDEPAAPTAAPDGDTARRPSSAPSAPASGVDWLNPPVPAGYEN